MPEFNKAASRRIVALVALTIPLGACSDIYFDRRDTISLASGEAQSANRVAQMVDPWSPASANRSIAFNGEKMQSAVERYRTNRVIQPVNVTTSSVAYQEAQQAAATANATQMNATSNRRSQGPAGFGSTNSSTASAAPAAISNPNTAASQGDSSQAK